MLIIKILKNLFLPFALSFSFVFMGNAQQNPLRLRLEYYKPINIFNLANDTNNGFHFPKNWGVAVGLEHTYKQTNKKRKYQTITIGGYNEVYFERVITLESNYGQSYNIGKALNAGFETGLGLHKATSSNLASSYKDGIWVSEVDKSNKTLRVVPQLSVNIGYDFSKNWMGVLPVSINLSIGGQLLFPYIKEQDFKLGIMRNNKITLKYHF